MREFNWAVIIKCKIDNISRQRNHDFDGDSKYCCPCIFKLRIVETNVLHESPLEMCQNYKQIHLACPWSFLADFGPIGDLKKTCGISKSVY